MYSKELEEIIDAALADGELTDKERAVLHKKAAQEGVDPDELDVVIDGRLAKTKKQEDWLRPEPPKQLANEKLGNIVKCPSCGAQVPGGAAVCPECGYEFRNVLTNKTTQKLSDGINAIRDKQRSKRFGAISSLFSNEVYSFITNYPVPNTSEDLLEALAFLEPKMDKDGEENSEEKACWILYCNCINKAQLNFKNDQRFLSYFQKYEGMHKKSLRNKILLGLGVGLFCVFIFGGLGFGLSSSSSTKDEIQTSIQTEADSLSSIISKLPTPTKDNIDECKRQITDLVWRPINCEFNDGRGGDDVRALQEMQINAVKAFVNKKNAYIKLINDLKIGEPIPEDSYDNYVTMELNSETEPSTESVDDPGNASDVKTDVDQQYDELSQELSALPNATADNVKDLRDQLRQIIWTPITTEAETAKKTFTSPSDDEKYERTKKEAFYKLVKVKAGAYKTIYEEAFGESDPALDQLAHQGYEE